MMIAQQFRSTLRFAVPAFLVASLCVIAMPPSHARAATSGCTITGTQKSEYLSGTSGPDVICGLGGDDRIVGLGGNDTLIGGVGNDILVGGDGNDILLGDSGKDTLVGGMGADTLKGGLESDIIRGEAGNDTVESGAGSDVVNGGFGNDFVRGGDGNDVINGDAGNDALAGDAGSDQLNGGAGLNTCTPGDRSQSCTMDSDGPVVSELAVSATEVSPGETVTFSFRATDDSGVNYADVRVGGYQGLIGWCFAVYANRVSGDERDGRYSATCQVPELTINDTLTAEILAGDVFGYGTSRPLQVTFAVVGASDDRDAPAYSDLVVPATATAGESLSIFVHLSDATGVRFANVILSGPMPGSKLWFANFTLVSGTSQDGVYRIDGQIPSNAFIGDYDVWLWVGDTLNNRTVHFNLGPVVVQQ